MCYLRKATKGDMMLLYKWANDKEVRKNAFHTHTISLEEHKSWYQKMINSENCSIFIYMKNEIPIGQIRLNYEGNCATIDYSIDKKYQGQGYSSMMLILAEKEILSTRNDIKYFNAEVKIDNIASRKNFEKLGYKSVEIIKYSKKLDNNYDTEILRGGGGERIQK